MKYKGFNITEPSLEMFQEFIKEYNLPISAEEVYNHYKKRNWLTKKGTKAKSVEVLCNVWNSIPAHRVGVIQGKAKNKPQKFKAHLQLKQHPNRQYSHRGYCPKQQTSQPTHLEVLAYLFQIAVFVGLGILIYKLI